MKALTRLLLRINVCVLVLKAAATFATEPEGSTLLGVAKLIVGADSIQLIKDDTLPVGLDLIAGGEASGVGVKHLSLGVGESFSTSDRHHMSTTYKLLRITGDSAWIAEDRSTYFPGAASERRSSRTVRIRTYGVEVPGQ